MTFAARKALILLAALGGGLLVAWSLHSPAEPVRTDMAQLFEAADRDGRVGRARKTRPVDVREAKSEEIVVSIIAGEGKETQSPPAKPGDKVVRNRCPQSGNEEILVASAKFAERYEGPTGPPDATGWVPYRPRGKEMAYFILGSGQGPYIFTAPWGEDMIARSGDAIVRDPLDAYDTYRIARTAFDCTYEILRAPQNP